MSWLAAGAHENTTKISPQNLKLCCIRQQCNFLLSNKHTKRSKLSTHRGTNHFVEFVFCQAALKRCTFQQTFIPNYLSPILMKNCGHT